MVVTMIARVTYWLGIFCVVAALGSRPMNVMGFEFLRFSTRGNSVDFPQFPGWLAPVPVRLDRLFALRLPGPVSSTGNDVNAGDRQVAVWR